MDCEKFKSIAFELASRELPADEEAEALKHVPECADCRKEYEENLRIIEALRSAGEAEAPADLLPNVMKRINADRRGNFNRIIRYCSAAAAAVILAAGAVALRPAIRARFTDDKNAEVAESVDYSARKTPSTAAGSDAPESEPTASEAVPTEEAAPEEGAVTAKEQRGASAEPEASAVEPPQAEASADKGEQTVQPPQSARSAKTAEAADSSAREAAPQNEAANAKDRSADEPEKISAADELTPVAVAPRNTENEGGSESDETEESYDSDDEVSAVSYGLNQPMGDDAIVSPEMAYSFGKNGADTDADPIVGRGSSGGSSSGSGSRGSGSGGGSVQYIAKTVNFFVDKSCAEALAIDTDGKSRSAVENELNALGVEYRVEEIPVDYTAEYRKADAARRAEIEGLCAVERCRIVGE